MDKPDDFGTSGSHSWDAVTDDELNLVLRPDEWPLLVEACRNLDLIDVLRAEFASDPRYIVKGSTGQPVINPLVKHIDTATARYQSIVKQLGVPDVDEERARQRAAQLSADMAALGRASWDVRRRDA
ncbi:hypothetical protein [Pseudonocardia sp. ICBG162]|uniref:hypothetical protein n=1 Tax=Pseudonocardia sp. ICBG162 TaxID=2846761 RepID=UPI001CF6E530|nr:hypothetical protein [Pseudonocardia sp. ICBG162]